MSFMQALEGILGAPQQRSQYEDFVNRYNTGPPSEGYSDQEVLQRYGQIAPQLPARDYQAAAREAFARMSPEERAAFGQYVQQQAQQQGVNVPMPRGKGPFDDPDALARMTAGVQQQRPDLLGQMFGEGGMLSSPFAKAALAGIAAMAAQKFLSGNRQGATPFGGQRRSPF